MKLILSALLSVVSSQVVDFEPLLQHTVPVSYSSGVLDTKENDDLRVMWSTVVRVEEDAPWMRLQFSNARLFSDSRLVITSLLDGAYQQLNSVSIEQWYHESAYFNGNAVAVEFIARGQGESIDISSVLVGENAQNSTVSSICDGRDYRELNYNNRNARLTTGGYCTCWLISNQCFLSAGHCGISNGGTASFNVPLSSGSGSPQASHPDDQYSMDRNSGQSQNGGVGRDWAYFGVFPNSNTGLLPGEAYNDGFYSLSSPADTMTTISGYGSMESNMPSEWNLVQTTHTGPWSGSTGSDSIRYRTDTTGGNSGSAVEQNGRAVGVHTHGGCSSTGGSNAGTSINQGSLQSALRSPRGVCA